VSVRVRLAYLLFLVFRTGSRLLSNLGLLFLRAPWKGIKAPQQQRQYMN
jgi:hypothetical protein